MSLKFIICPSLYLHFLQIFVSSLPKYSKRELKKCINCEELTKNKFCTSFCSSSYKHKEAYNDYLKNNYKYCNGGYTPKNFKDFFLNDQNNKCQ